jgi:hypothetical protein
MMADGKHVYVAVIEGRAVAVFDLEADDELEAEQEAVQIVEEDCFKDDMAVLQTQHGQPLWDSASEISVRPARDDEREIWRKSRDTALKAKVGSKEGRRLLFDVSCLTFLV